MRIRHATAVGILLIAVTATAAPPSSANGGPTDFATVSRAFVNKQGGLNVQGRVSCAGTAAAIQNGTYFYVGGTMEPADGMGGTITLAPTDTLLLLANSDQYTARQAVGRKWVVQVTHESSRMNPCYTDVTTGPTGETLECQVGAESCPWRTDWFGWGLEQGLLWDYPSGGKFVPGPVTVAGVSTGTGIMVLRDDRWYWANPEEGGMFLPYQGTVRAVALPSR